MNGPKAKAARKCAVCGKPEVAEYRPFCSRRCAHVDLQRWFSGRYAVPGEPAEDGSGTIPVDPER